LLRDVHISQVNEDKPAPLEDNAFFIWTAEILPIAAIGQPDKLLHNKMFANINITIIIII